MNLTTLSDDARRVQALARDLADQHLRPRARDLDAHHSEFPADTIRLLASQGLMGVNVSPEHGGQGAGVVAYSLAMTEIARADASIAVTMAVNNMVAEILQQFGTPAQRQRHIEPLVTGQHLAGSFLLSEPGSGSDAAGLTTRAVELDGGDGWRLDGQKMWITSGPQAGVLITWAKDSDHGISAFLVDPALADGVGFGAPEHKMGQHGSPTVAVTFEDTRLGPDAVLGTRGKGFSIAMVALDGGRIGIGSAALGLAEEALVLATQALEGRKGGRQDGERRMIAELRAQLEGARLLVLRAAWMKEQGEGRFSREASMAKLACSELASRAAEACLQVVGPADGMARGKAERLLRDARVTRIYEGTSEIQRIVIARELGRRGVHGGWTV